MIFLADKFDVLLTHEYNFMEVNNRNGSDCTKKIEKPSNPKVMTIL